MPIDAPKDIQWTYLNPDEVWTDQASGTTLGSFRDTFMTWINRGDLNSAQSNKLINYGIRKINRDLRVPEMEQVASFEQQEGHTAIPMTNLPQRLITFKDVIVDGKRYRPQPYRMLRKPSHSMRHSYARQAGMLYFYPAIKTSVEITYWQAFPFLQNDTDTSSLFDVSEDLLLYACLSYGGDFFKMSQQPTWEATYQEILSELNQQALDNEFLGGPLEVGVCGEVAVSDEGFTVLPAWITTDFGGDII